MKNLDDLLLKLAKCYFRGSMDFSLDHEDLRSMTWDWQEKFLEITVKSDLIKELPLSASFSRLFIKMLINCLEDQEVHDEMYLHLCQSMDKPCSNTFHYKHYVVGDNLTDIITIKETNKMVVDGTTGMRTWEAAMVLADWALCNRQVFRGKKVLELGSGVGFTGLTIAKHCAPKSMFLTDCHSQVLMAICDNIKINFPKMQEENEEESIFMNDELKIGAMILDWNAIENIDDGVVPDVLIGADIVYDPNIIESLCEVLKTFFDRNTELKVYIASVIRNEETFKAFTDSLRGMNFSYKELKVMKNVFFDWDENVDKKCLIQIFNNTEQQVT